MVGSTWKRWSSKARLRRQQSATTAVVVTQRGAKKQGRGNEDQRRDALPERKGNYTGATAAVTRETCRPFSFEVVCAEPKTRLDILYPKRHQGSHVEMGLAKQGGTVAAAAEDTAIRFWFEPLAHCVAKFCFCNHNTSRDAALMRFDDDRCGRGKKRRRGRRRHQGGRQWRAPAQGQSAWRADARQH